MSQIKSHIHSVKGKTVFMILYNYADCDYSIIKCMEKLEDAYKYICEQEAINFDKLNAFQMITINQIKDLQEHLDDEYLNICYISSGKYNKFNLCEYGSVSSYVIIPMVIC